MTREENDYHEEYLVFDSRLERDINNYVKDLSWYVIADLSDYYTNVDSDSVWSFIEVMEKRERG